MPSADSESSFLGVRQGPHDDSTDDSRKDIAWAQVCTLRSEARPPDEAFNPAVKRSGWQAPEDTGLWDTANEVKDQASPACCDIAVGVWPVYMAL